MPRWLWWTPVVLVAVLAATMGLRYGYLAAKITETDVINAYAAHYLAERHKQDGAETAKATDCVAYPGADFMVWIVVSCGPTPHDPARHYEFHVNRLGGLEAWGGPGDWSRIPRPASEAKI